MQTPAQRSARILSALEDLVAQEAAVLHARDFVAAAELAERAAPLIEFLTSDAGSAGLDSQLRRRIAALQERRRESEHWLAAQIALTREELRQTVVSQRRVACVAPVYGQGGARRPQLSLVG